MKSLRIALWVVPAVMLCFALGFFALALGSRLGNNSATSKSLPAGALPSAPDLNVPAPNFTLTDQWGRHVSLDQFRGKAVLLAFVDPECTTICPLTTQALVQAVHNLGAAGRRVQILGVAANPIQHSVADVMAYSQVHGVVHSWDFLTGSLAQLKTVWKEYGVYVAAVANSIDHDPITYVISPKGTETNVIWTPMLYGAVGDQVSQFEDSTAKALGLKSPKRTAHQPEAQMSPRKTTALPVVAGPGAGGKMKFGPNHPHVLVFMASWLTETTDLASRLQALDAYAAAAQSHRWPSLVAVDLGPTEPSTHSLGRFLAKSQLHLKFPIVLDSTGDFADGYQVKNAPWVEVTKPNGAIGWWHNGWVGVSSLEAEAQKLSAS